MNPQPNSHNHPELMVAMHELNQAILSLNDYRDKSNKDISDVSTVTYENSLIYKVRELYKKVNDLCIGYKIEITQDIILPEFIAYKNDIRPIKDL